MRRLLLLLLSSLGTQASLEAAQWPQGAGPNGNWAATGPAPPLHFSVRTGEKILWQTPLPETGQGGIAVHSGRIFVSCMAPWSEDMALSAEDAALYSHAIEKRAVSGKDTVALCLDQQSGKVLWSHKLEGSVPSIYTYPFSDATSASPVTDGEHVWFTNGGGQVACFTIDGTKVWERRWTPTFDGPFNKQYEPFLVPRPEGGATFVTMEPFPAPGSEDSRSLHGRWHHLVGLDAASGEVLWTSADTLTHYNAPTLVATADGPCLLHARGGPHQVPELPLGISLTRLTGKRAGQAVWRYEDPRKNHEASLQTMAYDEQHVYWLLKAPHNSLVVLDRNTGKELREISLTSGVTRTSFDPELGKWHTDKNVDLEKPVFPARYSMIAANGHVTFQCYATAWGKPNIGPPYSFARVHPTSGLVEYLEVPSGVVRTRGIPDIYLWRTKRSARPLNSRGIEVTGDDRCRWDGWDWVFNGSPTRVNDRLYFTLASGLVYVLDANAEHFDGRAFLALNDLGPADGVWSANSVSYSGGQLYHRTGAALIAIGQK
jgi:outer membrane protein assembly factor BamB